jgi:hypothetical protein
MILEMLQRFFLKIILHRQLADFALQLGDPPGIVREPADGHSAARRLETLPRPSHAILRASAPAV